MPPVLPPQSPGHVDAFSGPSHFESPHTAGQSTAQVLTSSPFSQTELPHFGPVLAPQSVEQTPISLDAHVPSPHTACAGADASGPGSLPSSLGLPSPQLHAANKEHTIASVNVLIMRRHPTNTKYEINDKLCTARRSSCFGAIHRLCKSTIERAAQRSMLGLNQAWILDENRLRVTTRFEQQLGMLM